MIGSSENRISYNGNGIATEFAYTFKILEKSDIKLLHVGIDGTEELLTKDYYVDMEKSVVLYPGYAPGAEIPEQNRPPILPVGERLVIYREVPITQESALDKHWPFNVIEAGLDKLTIICQQLFDRLQRSFYVSESTSTNFDTKVPIEAGKTFRVKDDGTGFEVTEDPGKVIDGATALLKQTTEQAEFAKEQADASSQSAVNAQNAAIHAEVQADSVKKYKALWFDSVAAMKAEPSLTEGAYVNTAGYYTPNDGGSASYLIREKLEGDIADDGSLHELANGLVAELIIENGTVNAKQFGAYGDSEHDDTEAIQAALNTNSEIVYIPDGVYMINNDGVNLHSNLQLIFSKGAILKKISEATVTKGKPIINALDCNNILICGGHIIGDMYRHKDSITINTEYHCNGIYIRGANNVIIRDVEVDNCIGDGICLGSYNKIVNKCIVENCIVHDCQRHGLSINAHKLLIRNCDIYGIYWLDGIDIESDNLTYSQNEDVIIENCYIHDFNTSSVSINIDIHYYKAKNCIVRNCKVDNIIFTECEGTSLVENCEIKNSLTNYSVADLYVYNSTINYLSIWCDSIKNNLYNCTINNFRCNKKSGNETNYTAEIRIDSCTINTRNDAGFEKYALLEITNSKLISVDEKYYTFGNGKVKIIKNNYFYMKHNENTNVRKCLMLNGGDFISLDNNVFDFSEIQTTTVNGMINVCSSKAYITNNTILANSALGGVYNGNALRLDYGQPTITYIIGNHFPSYPKLAYIEENQTVYANNNTLSNTLTQNGPNQRGSI